MSAGPRLRTDIVEVFVVRAHELLLLRRAKEPMLGTWQPVLGHVEAGETAEQAARRELEEETGLGEGGGLASLRALERVHPYFLPERDAVVLSPRFVALAEKGWEPALCAENDASKWVATRDAACELCWPSQRASFSEAVSSGLIAL